MFEAPPPTAPGDDERALAEGLRALAQDAWAKLYDRHYAQLWRYLYARTGDRDAADDLATHTFAEALASIARYRYTGTPILAWLYRIARNLAGKHRRQQRHEAPVSAEPAGGAPDDLLDSIALAEALRTLTEDQREVIALRYFAGYSTAEIAAAMGKGESAVYSLEARAIAALRRELTPREEFSDRPTKTAA
ncbi:MAG TPA: sigma-70 family RNA polymerase sigma factor [Dehalococcoidia bacterium]|nr:sigma-70 family RNA polymerase sigma factor [Dehalococcoidia bacterium]